MEIWEEPVRGRYPDPSLFALSGLEQMRAALRGDWPPPPIHHLTGLTVVDVGVGTSGFTLPASPWFQSASGMFLAGIAAVAADAPLGTAIYSTLPAMTPLSTSELSLSFLRPASVASGAINARGRVLHGGSKLGLSEVLVEDAVGRVLAHGSSRCFILPSLDSVDWPSAMADAPEPVTYDTPDPYLRPLDHKPLDHSLTKKMSGLEITRSHISGDMPLPPWARLFGSRPVAAEEGAATLEIPVTGWLTSGAGTMYGGIIALFADAAMLTSVYTTLPPNTASATLDIKVQYLRPVWPGDRLTAHAKVIHRGRTMAVANCEIVNSQSKRVATATGSTLLFPGRPIDLDKPVVPADEFAAPEE